MENKLVYIDLGKNKVKFCYIKIEKKDKEYFLTINSGKVGNKGSTTLAYKGTDYIICKGEFNKKVNERKEMGYMLMEDVQYKIDAIFGIENKYCDLCKKEIDKLLYKKIDLYLRNETNVDMDESNPACGKVICFSCQKKYNLYKVRVKKDIE